jgi:hypothetical protein
MLLKTVMQEMVRMLARQLDSAPAADELPFTAQVMVDDLKHYGLSDGDSNRVMSAFIKLGPLIQRWPTSKTVIEALPAPEHPYIPRIEHHVTTGNSKDPETDGLVASRPNLKKNVFLPGESYNDYIEALNKSGMEKTKFNRGRLIKNGWIDEAGIEREAIQQEGTVGKNSGTRTSSGEYPDEVSVPFE